MTESANGAGSSGATKEKSHRRPFAIAGKGGKVAAMQTLEQFSIKAASTNSRVLDEQKDGFKKYYSDDQLVEPKYNRAMLKELLHMNTWQARACKTKARDIAGGGWEIVERNPQRGADKRIPPESNKRKEDTGDQPQLPGMNPQGTGGMFNPPAGPGGGAMGVTGSVEDPDFSEMSLNDAEDPDFGEGEAAVAGPVDTRRSASGDNVAADEPDFGDGFSPPAGPTDSFGVDQVAKSEQEKLTEKFEDFETPLVETMYEVWLDFEACGACAFEITRENNDPEGEIDGIEHIPIETLRKHVSDTKYKQQIDNEKVWYKDIRAKGELDFQTGRPLDEEHMKARGRHAGGMSDKWDLRPPHQRGESEPEEVMEDRRATECVYIEDRDGPDVIPAIPAVYSTNSLREYNIAYLENYGVPAMMLLITGDYDPGEEDAQGISRMERFLEERLGELTEEPGSTVVVSIPTDSPPGEDKTIPVKVEAVPLNSAIAAGGFSNQEDRNRDEILTANQVDPYRAQIVIGGALGGSVAAETTEIYKQSTVKPKQTMLEHRLDKYVIRDKGKYPNSKISLKRLDSRDVSREASMAGSLFGIASITPNEIINNFRDELNLGPIVDHPAMDLHYLGGKPLDSDDVVPTETEQLMAQVQQSLAGLAGGAAAGELGTTAAGPSDDFGEPESAAATFGPGANAADPDEPEF